MKFIIGSKETAEKKERYDRFSRIRPLISAVSGILAGLGFYMLILGLAIGPMTYTNIILFLVMFLFGGTLFLAASSYSDRLYDEYTKSLHADMDKEDPGVVSL